MNFRNTITPGYSPEKSEKPNIKKQVNILELLIPDTMRDKLEVLAGVSGNDYNYTERGIKFEFKNSMVANKCQIIEFHDKILVEFRKESNNLIEGTYNKLVSETVIEKNELQEFFESQTGIYLSFI